MKNLKFTFVMLFLIKLCFAQSEMITSVNPSNLNKDSLIVISSENKNWSHVKELINSGLSCNINYQDNTPLIWASFYGDVEMVKYLLSKGADPNFGGDRTPIYVAWKGNFIEIVKVLTQNALSQKYDINGVKKGLLVKPSLDEIHNAIRRATFNHLSERFVVDQMGFDLRKVIVEDPDKQIIKVYADAFFSSGGIHKLGYLEYYLLTRKADGKWEAQMINR